MTNNTLTALKGVKVGHSTHLDKLTGCTVILFDKTYSTACVTYGGAVGAFNTEALKPGKTDYGMRGIFISGGSYTGLMSAAEIMECMRRDKIAPAVSEDVTVYNPPLAGAIVYDQGMRLAAYDPKCGREAYENASVNPVERGNVGAGTGTSVGKFRWLEKGTVTGAMKAGVGCARVDVGGGIIVTALTVVNALGNVVLPNGEILAGNRDEKERFKQYDEIAEFITGDKANTTITVVGINVDLKAKEHYERIAHIASHGQVRAINPVNLSADGDTVFVFSTGELKDPFNEHIELFKQIKDNINVQVDIIGNAAAKAVQESIYDACRQAETVQFAKAYKGIIPSAKDFKG